MRVFVSHGTPDRWIARQIRRCIADVGANAVSDAYEPPGGEAAENRIWNNLNDCDELLVLFTPQSSRRSWLWMEIGAARVMGKPVVAVLYGLTADELARKHGTTIFRTLACDLNEIDLYFEELRARCTDER